MKRRYGGRPLRIPQTPHPKGYRLVPVSGCGCETCRQARIDNDPEAAHWARVGNLLGIEDEQEERAK